MKLHAIQLSDEECELMKIHRDFIESLPADKLNMDSYRCDEDGDYVPFTFSDRYDTEICGSVGCAIGWMPYIKDERFQKDVTSFEDTKQWNWTEYVSHIYPSLIRDDSCSQSWHYLFSEEWNVAEYSKEEIRDMLLVRMQNAIDKKMPHIHEHENNYTIVTRLLQENGKAKRSRSFNQLISDEFVTKPNQHGTSSKTKPELVISIASSQQFVGFNLSGSMVECITEDGEVYKVDVNAPAFKVQSVVTEDL